MTPAGGKLWRFKWVVDRKEQTLSIGPYPLVSLKEARERRDEARRSLLEKKDPRRTRAESQATTAGDSFKEVAREWHSHFAPSWTTGHADGVMVKLEKDVFPYLGARPANEVTAPELLAVIRRVEDRGAHETARRVRAICGQVLKFAVATGRAERDWTLDIRGAMAPAPVKHFPAVTDPREVGALLRAIDGYQGDQVTRCALRLSPLVFVRPGELRNATWAEFNLEAAEWRIPAERMKMRDLHIVPLSRQALEMLAELRLLTGSGQFLFPSPRGKSRPFSNNTLNAALRRMGYRDEMTAHGFRSMASTLLNEQGWNRDAIERQRAHSPRDEVRAAFNRAEFLDERRRMMQAWADHLDKLKAGGEVVAFPPVST